MPVNTFQQFLPGAFTNGVWATDEVVFFVLPLFEEVLHFHESGRVGAFERPDAIFLADGRLHIAADAAHAPLLNQQALTHPVYLEGYLCHEITQGHHDVQSDIFCLGLILGSAVMGLNLYVKQDLEQFISWRHQPAALNGRIHPTLCAMVTEMTALDRSERSRDLADLVQRLKYYRDYDPERERDLSQEAVLQVKQPAHRKAFILSKLRNRLFDTSRRNRLLYYKPNSRFVNLTIGSVPAVKTHQSIHAAALFTWNPTVASLVTGMKDLLLNKYLCFEDHPYLGAQLNQVRREAESDEKEYGFSQLRLVIAFLHWNNLKEDNKERISSPLLLLPVQLKRSKALKEERFTLEIADNTAMINPVLAHFLKDLYGLELPESIDLDEVDVAAFFEALRARIEGVQQGVSLRYLYEPRTDILHYKAEQTIQQYRKRLEAKEVTLAKPAPVNTAIRPPQEEINPYSWDFDVCNLVVGNFNYKKMSLVSDYAKVADQEIAHPVFDELFSHLPRKEQEPVAADNATNWYHVIAADPTQTQAVLHSRTGRNYVIQGPPGTGKSQTITNLIADFLAQGKNILFVCEKRAALDVVYHRLQQNKLSELCCYIHDSQGDKKEFIRDLKTVYDDFLNHPMDLHTIALHRKVALERMEEQMQLLQAYHSQQCAVQPEAGLPVRGLVEAVLRSGDTLPEMNEKLSVPVYNKWLQFGPVIRQLSEALEHSGAAPELAKHAFSNLGNPVMLSDSPFTLMEDLSGHALSIIEQLSRIITLHHIPSEHAEKLSAISNLLKDAAALAPLAVNDNLQLVNPASSEAKEFEGLYQQYQQLLREYQQATEATAFWQQKFSKQEVQQALDIARKYEQSFWSFLSGNWRRLKKQLQKAYGFASHQLPPSYTTVLQQLQEEYQAQERTRQLQAALQRQYGVDNINTMYVGIDVLRRRKGDAAVDYLLHHPEANELVLQLSRFNNSLHQLELQLRQCLHNYEAKSLHQVHDELITITSNGEALKELLPALRRFAALPADLQELLRKVPLTPQQAEAVMAHATLRLLLERHPGFANTNHWNLKDIVSEIGRLYNDLLSLNSDYIRATRRHDFLANYKISNTTVSQLTPEQRVFKKEYTEGRRVLEHEMGKSKQYKSIRTLASNESGRVLKDLKPVWLMSPLSVSDSLPLDLNYFDVVIFDEASQITLEEGVPALFRAPQTIIVGDDKQMPPSNFFSAKVEDTNDLEIFEGEEEDEILSTEADSLLVQGSRKLYNTMLKWHYRSRYETLISYSNHAFYGADLLTVPDRTISRHNKPGIEVQRSEEGIRNAQHLLNSSMSFHYLPAGIYADRANRDEAAYIAVMVRELLLQQVEETIGIVAFSQEQQRVITDALDDLAAVDKNFDILLEKAFNRKENGQFTGLFVKNLENVQGDERDIIIMSVCYGHDRRQKMLMNFGPVNRKGGEKRLNVIFSRARKHMAVVSSIRHHHITNDYNAGASYLKRFLHYAEMVSTGNPEQARLILDSLAAGDQTGAEQTAATYTATTQQIRQALEAKGYITGEAVGQSSFKCSLAVKAHQDDGQYSLGIMVDDDLHYHNKDVIEQYYQRPAILEAFGWKIAYVFAKDWLEDRAAVLQFLLQELGQQPAIPAAASPALTILLSATGDRFWEIGRAGTRITMRFGKAGTKGQMQIRTYLNETEAIAAMEQLVADQRKQRFAEPSGHA